MAPKMTSKTKPATARRARTKLVRTSAAPPSTRAMALREFMAAAMEPVLRDPRMREFVAAGSVPPNLPTLPGLPESLGKPIGAVTIPTLAQVLEQTDALRSRVGALVGHQADLVHRLTGQYPLEPVNAVRGADHEGMAARLDAIVRDLHDMAQQLDVITAALSRQL